MTFARPFQLDGLDKVLPVGVYSVESENDILDGMFLPDCLRTPVLIYLHSTPGSPGYSQTLRVPRDVLEAALLRDRGPAVVVAPEPEHGGMLLDPTVRHLMRSHGVPEAFVRDLISHLPKRNLSHVKSE